MYNPFDSGQTRSLVGYRREQMASAAARRRVVTEPDRRDGLVTRARVMVGAGLMRAGARIAGISTISLISKPASGR